jgi:molecular chaperone DnaJ
VEGSGFSGFSNVEDIFNFSDIFGSVLGDLFGFGSFGGRGRSSAARGSNLKAGIRLTLEDAFRGTKREIKLRRRDPCPDCKGTGAEGGNVATCPDCRGTGQSVTATGFLRISVPCRRCGATGRVAQRRCGHCRGEGSLAVEKSLPIAVPAGVDSGDTLRIAGEGEAGQRGGPPGDLFVVFEVEPHPFLKREGPDLHMDLPVAFTQAILGADVEVESLDGKVTVEIPAGTQPGQTVLVKKRGMPDPESGRRGGLHVHVRVLIPKDLSREQRKAVAELEKLMSK